MASPSGGATAIFGCWSIGRSRHSTQRPASALCCGNTSGRRPVSSSSRSSRSRRSSESREAGSGDDIRGKADRSLSRNDARRRKHDRAGIFMMPTVMASIGSVSSLGWFVTAPGAFIMGYMFARLGRASPKAGGPYAYAREALGDFAGFQCNLLYWFSNVIANIAIATSVTGYLTVFIPALRTPLAGACCTVLVIWFSAGLNIIGPRLVTRFETFTTILGIGPIAAVGLGGWFFFNSGTFDAGWNPNGLKEYEAVAAAVSIMFWSFMGVESASVAAAVVKDPEKNIGRATLLGV